MYIINESAIIDQENEEVGGYAACLVGCGTFCLINVAFIALAAVAVMV